MRKRQRSPPRMAPSLAALPSACLAVVLGHLVGPGAACHALYPEPFALVPWHRELAKYARVCREWRAVAAQLAAQMTRSVARVDVSAAVAQPFRLGFGGIDHHVSANDLRLVMRSIVTVSDIPTVVDPSTATWFAIPHDYEDAVQLRSSHRVMRSMSSIAIDWHTVLAPRAPHLVRLDLSQTPLDCTQLGCALLAASTSCPRVRVLALPRQTARRYSEDVEAKETNLNELYGALQRWHRSNGGLVHLRIPFGRFDENTAVRLLRSIIAYCPAIEFLDGWQDTYRVDDDGLASCEAYWPAPAHWWAALWRTCTKLRAFHTVVMPFDDEYIAALRPKGVESLVIAIDSAKARHFEVSRESMLLMALRFRGLRCLRLEIPFVRDDVWYPRACIDDEFVCSLASSSPQLREFRLQCLDTRVFFTIGRRGVGHLAELEHLEAVEFQRLQTLDVAMAIDLLRGRANVELAYSFATGESEVWQLLRYLADVHTTNSRGSFSVLLWWLGDGRGCHGIRQVELDTLVQRLSSQHVHVRAHTKRRTDHCRDDAVVDLAHLDIRVGAPRNETCRGNGHTTTRRLFEFPVCVDGCTASPEALKDSTNYYVVLR